ncbi:DUF1559 family PulG-like putative transporter [Crateriforma conspicua]|uniref:DUF1559 domain-containing protein n=1 Tax=Crateriforma conspicua TaxID=2527996 RepID=A0A5C5Y7H4_9PLAN|nr:DUF1559 domain-containing protein [Crateriforma conspicua]QDV65528.1 hypothetical protein Mal65_46990 [Crateriforma conspicua]TWT70919.1 hypothetical protein Pan14r_32270 [Crateriforma conspicua]
MKRWTPFRTASAAPSRILLVLAASLAVFDNPAPAQASGDVPWSDQIIAAARLNLQTLDAAATGRLIADAASVDVGDIAPMAKRIDEFVTELRSLGCTDVYLAIHTSDMLRGVATVLIQTVDPDSVRQRIEPLWKSIYGRTEFDANVDSGWLILGPATTVKNWTPAIDSGATDGSDRWRDLIRGDDENSQLAIALPNDMRQTLAAMWPQQPLKSLPSKLSPAQWVRVVQSARIALSLPPQGDTVIEIETADADAATTLADELTHLRSSLDWIDDRWSVSTDGPSAIVQTSPDVLIEQLAAAVGNLNQRSMRLRTMNNLKQIGLAMHNHHAAFKAFPDAAIRADDGGELLSWRVKLLPFLEQQALYEAIQRDAAWDSEVNRKVTQTAVPNFGTPDHDGPMTNIRIPVIPGSMYDDPAASKSFRSITDGTSNTIALAVAPADQAVPWTRPGLWELDTERLVESFFGDRDTVPVLMFDGAAVVLDRAKVDAETLQGMLTIAGGEVVQW